MDVNPVKKQSKMPLVDEQASPEKTNQPVNYDQLENIRIEHALVIKHAKILLSSLHVGHDSSRKEHYHLPPGWFTMADCKALTDTADAATLDEDDKKMLAKVFLDNTQLYSRYVKLAQFIDNYERGVLKEKAYIVAAGIGCRGISTWNGKRLDDIMVVMGSPSDPVNGIGYESLED